MARSQSSNKMKAAGHKPIAQDATKAMELQRWCELQTQRQTAAHLIATTGDKFKAFSTQSLAKKMSTIFDKMFGRGKNSLAETEEDGLSPSDIMSAARAGSGLVADKGNGEHAHNGKVTPIPVASSAATFAGKEPLYADNENSYVPWIDVFQFTHEAQGEGPVNYIGISMGADGMFEPEGVIKEDGMLLEIVSQVPSARDDIDDVYESRQDKYLGVAGNKESSKEAKKSAKRKYNMLEARRTAQLKAVREMKALKGDQWKYQYTRVPLDVPVEKSIVNAEVHNGKKGKTLSIDLKVVRDGDHIDRLVIKEAVESPEKP